MADTIVFDGQQSAAPQDDAPQTITFDGQDSSQSQPSSPPPQQKTSSLKDRAIDLARGEIGEVQGVRGLVGDSLLEKLGLKTNDNDLAAPAGYTPNNNQTAQQADQQLQAQYSPKQAAANEAVSSAQGVLGKTAAYLQNPRAALSDITEMAPAMQGGMGGMVLQAGGGAAEAVRESDPNASIGDQLSAGAIAAGATALGGVAGKYLTPFAEAAASKVGQGVGTVFAAGSQAAGDFLGRATGKVAGVAVEGGVPMAAMSGGQQAGENVGEGKPWSQGVGEAALEGGVAGIGFHLGHAALGAITPGNGGHAFVDGANNPEPTQPNGPAPQLGYDATAGQTPHVVFPDGSVATSAAQVDQYISSLPADQQIAARAKLLGMGQQPVETDPGVAAALNNVHAGTGLSTQDMINQTVGIGRPPATTSANVSAALSEPTNFVQQDQHGLESPVDAGQYADIANRPVAPDAQQIRPESLATIAAQLDAIRDPSSAKDTMIVTPGSPMPPDTNGLHQIETNQGTIVTSNPDKAQAILDAHGQLTGDMVGQLLGYTGPKSQSDGTVVQALDRNGNVVHEEMTNATSLPNAMHNANLMAPEGGTVQVTNVNDALQKRQAGVDQDNQAAQRNALLQSLFAKVGPRMDQYHSGLNQPIVGAHSFDNQLFGSTPEYNKYVDKQLATEAQKSQTQHDVEQLMSDAWRKENPSSGPTDANGLGPYPDSKTIKKYVDLTGVNESPTPAQAVAKIDIALKKLERSKAQSSIDKVTFLNAWREELTRGDPNAKSIHASSEDGSSTQGSNAQGVSAERSTGEGSSASEGSAIAEGTPSGSAEPGVSGQGTEAAPGTEVPGPVAGHVRAEPAAGEAAGQLSPQAQRVVGTLKLRKGARDGQQGQLQAAAGDVGDRPQRLGPDAVRPAGVDGQPDGVQGGAARDGGIRSAGAADSGHDVYPAASGGVDAAGGTAEAREVDDALDARMRQREALVDAIFTGPKADRNKQILLAHFGGDTHQEIADRMGLDRSTVTKLVGDGAIKKLAPQMKAAMDRLGMAPSDLMEMMRDSEPEQAEGNAAETTTPHESDGLDRNEVSNGDNGSTRSFGEIGSVGGSQGNWADTGSLSEQWIKATEAGDTAKAKELEAQMKANRETGEFDTKEDKGRQAWEAGEEDFPSGTAYDDLPESLRREWNDFASRGHSSLSDKNKILDRFDRGDYDEAYESHSAALNQMAEAHPEIGNVETELNKLGIGHAIDAPVEWATHDSESGEDGYAEPVPGGGMRISIANETLGMHPFVVSHTVRHELGHVVDDVAHGGVYSIQPELTITRGADGSWTPVGEVAKELDALWKSGNPLGAFVDYPLNTTQYGRQSLAKTQGELFAQMWSMATDSRFRAILEQHAPATMQFMNEVFDDIRQHPESVSGGTRTSAAERSNDFSGRGAEGVNVGGDGVSEPAAAEPAAASRNPWGNTGTTDRLRSAAGAAEDRPGAGAGPDAASRFASRGGAAGEPEQRGSIADRAINALPENFRPAARSIADTISSAVKRGAQTVAFGHDLANWAATTLDMHTPRAYMEARSAEVAYRKDLDDALGRVMDGANSLKWSDKDAASEYLAQTRRSGQWGYKPDFYANAQVDPATRARFDALSKPVQDVIKSVNKLGHDQRQQLRDVNDALKAQFGKDAPVIPTPMDDGPYVPMRRHGDFVVEGKSAAYKAAEAAGDDATIASMKADPSHYQFSARDTMGQAKALRRELEQRFGTNNVDAMSRDQYFKDNHGASWEKLQGWINKITDRPGDTPEDKASNAAFRSQLTDLYLRSIADSSARASELRFKNVAGVDDKQTLMSVAQNGARHNALVSSMVHNKATSDAMKAMSDDVANGKDADNRARRQDMVNEFQARHIAEMNNPPPSKILNNLLQANSFWKLALSPAHYFQYAAQPFTMAMPDLAARYGWGKAAAAHLEAHGDVLNLAKRTNFTDPDISKHVSKVGDEAGMLQALKKNGSLDSGHAGDYGDVNLYGNRVRAGFENVLDKVTGVARGLETGNRISSSLTAYRLSYEASLARGETTDTAHRLGTKYATDTLRHAYGDYSAANTPRVLMPGFYGNGVGGQVARAIAQFKKFTVIHSSLAAGMFHESFAGATPMDRAVARKSLAFLYGHYGILAGALGMPGAAVVGGIVNKLFGDDGDTTETTMRKWIGDNDVADLLLHGAPGAAGEDMTQRWGVGDLPNPFPGIEDSKSLGDALQAAAGPIFGTATNVLAGAGKIAQGDYLGGLTQVLPTGITNVAKAYRMATQGSVNSRGDVLGSPDDVGPLDVAAKFLGGSSTKDTTAQDQANSVRALDQQYQAQAKELIGKYTRAYNDDDSAALGSIRDQWMDMQDDQRQRGHKLTPLSELMRSPYAQQKRGSQSLNGVGVNRGDRQEVEQVQAEEGEGQ